MRWELSKTPEKVLNSLKGEVIKNVEFDIHENDIQNFIIHMEGCHDPIKIFKETYAGIKVYTPKYTIVYDVNGCVGKNLVLATETFEKEKDAERRAARLSRDHSDGEFKITPRQSAEDEKFRSDEDEDYLF